MIKKIIELIKDALRHMIAYKDVSDTVDIDTVTISDKMQNNIDLWSNIYCDESPWLSDDDGIYSLNLGKSICQELARSVMSELESSITDPNAPELSETEIENTVIDLSNRANFLNDCYMKNLMKCFDDRLEMGMATGGMVIKPYVSNGRIYFDFCYQGEFYPIAFDDDGNITDIAFIDEFISGDFKYSKIERQTFADNTIVVENKAYKTKIKKAEDDSNIPDELGTEIDLKLIDRWAYISPQVTIQNVDRPLYGYYKVPLANNIDKNSPLGISVFSPAVKMIERADKQFSRLDWEYEGGQMAIDIDESALHFSEGYFGTQLEQDQTRNRLYRKVDLGTDDTYNAFAPSLRDNNYLAGLTRYLTKIEDLVGLARGTLSEVDAEARTATEIKILKQRQYVTVSKNQTELQRTLEDVVYAMNTLAELYNLSQTGEYNLNLNWKDSILTDTDTELSQKINLKNAGILMDWEVRAWYTGEDEETAKAVIQEKEDKEQAKLANDIFGSNNKEE